MLAMLGTKVGVLHGIGARPAEVVLDPEPGLVKFVALHCTAM